MKTGIIVLTCLVGVALGVFAQESKPFQASLTPDIAIHEKSERIEGLSLSIWGQNPQTSLALGFVNGTSGDSTGVSFGFIGNYAENYTGVQLGLANYASDTFTGVQWGFLNYTGKSFRGAQVGFANGAEKLSGLQLGVVNYAVAADAGIQIGFANIILENKVWFSNLPDELAPGMIFVNWRF